MYLLLLIVLINVSYMTLMTLRTILVFKGFKKTASFIAILEVFIYLMGLALVLDSLNEPLNIFAYCLGWGIGVYCGGLVENKLALGYVVFDVILENKNTDLIQKIRSKGYGVTSWVGEGRDGVRMGLKVIVKRRHIEELRSLILRNAPSAFIISYEPNHLDGGFIKRKHI